MATLQELMAGLKTQRERASESSPIASVLGKTIAGMDQVATAINKLHLAVEDQVAANMAARKTGEAKDVQQAIRNLLQAKVAEDKIEADRSKRMMDMADRLVPQVTEEQLKAFRMQQLVYREHKKTLEATVAIEEKKAAVQKKTAEDIAKRRIEVIEKERTLALRGIEARRAEANFAIKDKYGTIESAIGGLANKGQDPFSKFLVSGWQRYVAEKKEAPKALEVKDKFDEETKKQNELSDAAVKRQNDIANNSKALADKILNTKKDDIAEDFAIRAAKNGISDPGSAAKLYADRAQQVKALAGEGTAIERQLISGKAKFAVPKMEQAVKEVATAIRTKSAPPAEVPVLTRSGIESSVDLATAPKAEVSKPAEVKAPTAETASPQVESPKATEAQPAPKNARFEKANRQKTRPNGVTRQRAPQAEITRPASTGPFGSKGGFVAGGDIAKALGGIVGKLGSLASSALKFLGPWAFVANALMSFDRLVPLISDGAGALMDMSKLIMPLTVTALMEGFAGLLQAINALINVMPGTTNMDKKTAARKKELLPGYQAEADAQFEANQRRKQAITGYGTFVVDTTSARRNGIGSVAVTRRETALTSPSEAAAITEQARAAQAPALNQYQVADWNKQQEQNQAMRESVMVAAKTPGTTPIMVANPAMAPWNV